MSKIAVESDNLLAVPIEKFRSAIRDITFDVYLKLAEDKYAHVFSRTTGLDYRRLAQYIDKGVNRLYIRKQDLDAFNAFVSRSAESIFHDENSSTESKIATLLNMTEQNMTELFTQFDVADDTAEKTRRVINNYVNVMMETPETLAIILKLVSHGEYLYYHSIAVAIFSMFIAKASGQFNQRTLELVGMGGFLHDIGCTKLPDEVINSPTDLTTEQWAQMHRHPTIGLKMLENTKNISDEVRHIVYQHHEQPSGHGYPNACYGAVIYYPAKIVGLADSFSALISDRPFRKAYTPEKALKIIESETGKFDRDLVRFLVSIFGRRSGGKAAA